MAELIVRVKDKHPINPASSKRGDVISVLPDGAQWGDLDQSDTHYRIIRLPNVSVEDVTNALLAPGRRSSPTQERAFVPFRSYRLDLKHADVAAHCAGTRPSAPLTLSWTLEDLVAARKRVG